MVKKNKANERNCILREKALFQRLPTISYINRPSSGVLIETYNPSLHIEMLLEKT